ncbi:MAG: dTMP kinase [Pirellula sp.]|nr:dTMP kinase [Pirellula sp.]
MFITLDGIDGAGKSTQIAMLRDYFVGQGHEVVCVRDPGSSKLGDAVRDILLHREDIPLAMTAEMFLYMASRAQLVHERIRPAIESGAMVICDRYLLANVVYQGSAGGLDVETLWTVGHIATGGLMPDATIVLDLEPELAASRLQRGGDRLEKRGLEYFKKVREGFRTQLARCGKGTLLVDASLSPEAVHQTIIEFLSRMS